MRRLMFLIAVLAAAAMFALPHGSSVTSPVGQLQSIRAMFRCEASSLGALAHDPASVAPEAAAASSTSSAPGCLPR